MERSEVLYSDKNMQIRILYACRCSKAKLLDTITECGMSFLDNKGVVVFSGEQDFCQIEIDGKCDKCGGKGSGLGLLASLLADENVKKWLPDALEFLRHKPIRRYFVEEDIVPRNFGCAQTLITLASDGSEKESLQEFAKKKLEFPAWVGTLGKQLRHPRIDAALNAYFTMILSNNLSAEATPRQQKLQHLYLSSVETVARMELHGFAFDKKKSAEMVAAADKEMKKEEQEIYKLAGQKWNLNSAQATADILYEKMGLEMPKGVPSSSKTRTKTHPSTSTDVLKHMSHPIAKHITSWRTLDRAVATLRGLEDFVDPLDGRIRSRIDSNNIHTGRISSADPNLHALGKEPLVRDESVRAVMVAEKGNLLLDGDYGQLDLRVLGELSGDPALVKLLNSDSQDIFTDMASLFKAGTTRNATKRLCYSLIYGMGPRRLGAELEIPLKEAQELITRFYELYPVVKAWLDAKVDESKETTVSESYMGRSRALSMERHGSKVPRQGVNHVVQATSAEVFRKALVDVEKAVEGLSGKIVNQVHDEIVIEVSKNKAKACAKALKEAMEGAFAEEFKVKFPVKVRAGPSWSALEEY